MNSIFYYLEKLLLNKHYTDSSLHSDEFVGRVPVNKSDFSSFIENINFKRVGEDWVKELDDKQLHIFCYDGSDIESGDDGYSYIYAHFENKWGKREILTPEKNGPEGVRRMKKLLDENGLKYEPIRP